MFAIMYIHNGTYIEEYRNSVRQFASAEAAQSYLNTWFPWDKYNYRIDPWDNAEWRMRERERFLVNQYVKPVWHDELWYKLTFELKGHYASINALEPTKISYFESAEKGAKDRPTNTLPGRFLKRFYGDILSDEEIKEFANKHREKYAEPPELHWASTPEEIRAVYERPAPFTSCMQHPKDKWKFDHHPVEAYGAGDLSVAYITNSNDDLLARCLVWKANNKVGRVYGDVHLMRACLRKEGIETESNSDYYDNLEGARMLYLPVPHKQTSSMEHPPVLLPYIDSSQCSGVTKLDDTYMVIGPTKRGQYRAYTQDALHYASMQCSCCTAWGADNYVVIKPFEGRTDRTIRSNMLGHRCEVCVEKGTFYCSMSGYHFDDTVFTKSKYSYYQDNLSDQQDVCTEYMQRHPSYFLSDYDKVWYSSDYRMVMGTGRKWTRHQAMSYGRRTISGLYYPVDEVIAKNGRWYTIEEYGDLDAGAFDLFPREVANG